MLPVYPPNMTTRPLAESYAIAWWLLAVGPEEARWVQLVPSHSHVSAK